MPKINNLSKTHNHQVKRDLLKRCFCFKYDQSQLKPPVHLCNVVGQLCLARGSEVVSEREEAGVGKNDCENKSTDCSFNLQASVLIC